MHYNRYLWLQGRDWIERRRGAGVDADVQIRLGMLNPMFTTFPCRPGCVWRLTGRHTGHATPAPPTYRATSAHRRWLTSDSSSNNRTLNLNKSVHHVNSLPSPAIGGARGCRRDDARACVFWAAQPLLRQPGHRVQQVSAAAARRFPLPLNHVHLILLLLPAAKILL